MMDRNWPHQAALPAYRCLGHNYLSIQFSAKSCRSVTLFCLASAHTASCSVIASGELMGFATGGGGCNARARQWPIRRGAPAPASMRRL